MYHIYQSFTDMRTKYRLYRAASSLELPTAHTAEGTHTQTHTYRRHAEQIYVHKCVCLCVCVCSKECVCADEITPVEFLDGEYEAGLVNKQGFYSFWSLVTGPKDC